jgi:hypothetical protein
MHIGKGAVYQEYPGGVRWLIPIPKFPRMSPADDEGGGEDQHHR